MDTEQGKDAESDSKGEGELTSFHETQMRYEEIWKLSLEGKSNREIAEDLNVSDRTIARARKVYGQFTIPHQVLYAEDDEPPKVLPERIVSQYKLAKPPSMRDPGYTIFYGKCPNCSGDVEFYMSSLEMRCLQCAFNGRNLQREAQSA